MIHVRNSTKGITLIELLVVMAVGVMLFGLILQMFISTNTATKKENLTMTLAQEVSLITRQIEKELNTIIPESGEVEGQFIFDETALTILNVSGDEVPQSTQVTFSNMENENRNRVIINRTPYREASAPEPSPEIPGLNEPSIATRITFAYATEIDNFEPRWRASLSKGEFPVLIQYTITAFDTLDTVRPYTLTSAVCVK